MGMIYATLKWLIPAGMRVHGALKKVDTIYAEVRPNGGTSLRDSIYRQETAIAKIIESQELGDARQWAIVSSGIIPTWESSDEGACLRPNNALLELVGRSAEQMVGNGWENILHKDDAHRCWAEWQDAIKKRKTFESTYRIVNHTTNATYEVVAKTTPIISPNGVVKGWIGTYTHIKEVSEVPSKKPRARRTKKTPAV